MENSPQMQFTRPLSLNLGKCKKIKKTPNVVPLSSTCFTTPPYIPLLPPDMFGLSSALDNYFIHYYHHSFVWRGQISVFFFFSILCIKCSVVRGVKTSE